MKSRWLSSGILAAIAFTAGSARGEDEELDLVKLLQADLSVVSATKTKQTLAESPAVISVVTRQQIEANDYRSIAEALQTVPGLYVNSNYVFYDIGVRGISGELNGNSQLLKVMINGQPMALRNDHTNLVGPESIPMDIVDHIEIIRGPASALYGANAFLGVINIITRGGSALDGMIVRGRATTFNGWHSGYDFDATAGRVIGPVDVSFSLHYGQTNRSGLTLPCGTLFAGKDDACALQRTASKDGSIFDRSTAADVSRPFSFFGRAQLDLGHLLVDDDGRFGRLTLSLAHQHLNSGANFAEWGVMQSARYVSRAGVDLGPIAGTANRIGLDNTVVRGEYELSLLRDRVTASVYVASARSGVNDDDFVVDHNGHASSAGQPITRRRYGANSVDLGTTLRFQLVQAMGKRTRGVLAGANLVDDVTLIAIADQSTDRITYPGNAFTTPVTFLTSDLVNRGASAQLTAAFLGKRVGLVAGGRYDDHRGATLTDDQLARTNGDLAKLCSGRQVCYSSFNYRGGLTATLLRDAGQWRAAPVIDELYVKLLYGTSFKAPAPSFLYDDGYYGSLPLRASASLLPQNATVWEGVVGFSALQRALTGTLVYFRGRITDRVAFRAITGGILAQNADAVKSSGIEASLAGKLGLLDFAAGLAWQDSQTQFPAGQSNRITDTYGFPSMTGSLNVGVTLMPIKTRVGATARTIGRRVGSPLNTRSDATTSRYELPSYTVFDLTVRAGRFNIFNENRPSTLTLSVRNLFNASYQFSGFQPYYRTDLPGEPRSVFLGLEQSF